MAKNYVQEGDTLTLAAPANVLSGAGVQVGNLFGVAQYDALSGVDVELDLEGVYDLSKVSAQAWTQGQALYWDDSAKLVTTVSGANLPIGHAALIAANPSAIGRVLITNIGPAGSAGLTAVTATVLLTNGDSGYVVSPVAGHISRIDGVLTDGVVATNDAVVTCKIGAAGAGVAVTNGVFTVTAAGSAIGDADTASPTGANTVVAGGLIYFTVSGTPGGSRNERVAILISP